jgi:hypothetical protein
MRQLRLPFKRKPAPEALIPADEPAFPTAGVPRRAGALRPRPVRNGALEGAAAVLAAVDAAREAVRDLDLRSAASAMEVPRERERLVGRAGRAGRAGATRAARGPG